MADIVCVVCGEPWDSWGVRNGEMPRWQASLFLKGAGCPCCEGESPFPESGNLEKLAGIPHPEEAFLRDRLRNNPDDGDQPKELTDGSPRLPWVMGEPKPLWSCAGCDVQVIIDPKTDFPGLRGREGGNLTWHGGKAVHYIRGSAWRYGMSTRHEEPEDQCHGIIVGEEYCPGCVTECEDHCGELIFVRSELSGGDTYDPGSAFSAGNRLVCITCFEDNHLGEE